MKTTLNGFYCGWLYYYDHIQYLQKSILTHTLFEISHNINYSFHTVTISQNYVKIKIIQLFFSKFHIVKLKLIYLIFRNFYFKILELSTTKFVVHSYIRQKSRDNFHDFMENFCNLSYLLAILWYISWKLL